MDETGTWAFGYGYGFPTQELADKRALIECNKNREQYTVLNECKVYMQGNSLF